MILRDLGITKSFLLVLAPAALGGALWEAIGLPLGWLMGAAVVTGAVAMANVEIVVPRPIYNTSLALLGASVGLAITPEVAAALVSWAPIMMVAAALGILAALMFAPVLSRWGKMETATAFFSLLPGGIVEMANVGERHGADRTIIAALHAIRVALVVGILPLALSFFGTRSEVADGSSVLSTISLLAVFAIGAAGGWTASKTRLPAAWLLGALILVGVFSSMGSFQGRIPGEALALVQVFVGISLGSRFTRARLQSIPRALAAGLPVLLVIMALMALAGGLACLAIPFSIQTLILCFSIGGMAEMVLTSKALGLNVALVAAFQTVRAVMVNACAGAVWHRFSPYLETSNDPKG